MLDAFVVESYITIDKGGGATAISKASARGAKPNGKMAIYVTSVNLDPWSMRCSSDTLCWLIPMLAWSRRRHSVSPAYLCGLTVSKAT